MILYYEVYEKGTSWEGNCFASMDEVNEYIEGQVILSERTYETQKTRDDYKIIPHTYMTPEDLLRDEYEEEYDYYLKQKELGIFEK